MSEDQTLDEARTGDLALMLILENKHRRKDKSGVVKQTGCFCLGQVSERMCLRFSLRA